LKIYIFQPGSVEISDTKVRAAEIGVENLCSAKIDFVQRRITKIGQLDGACGEFNLGQF
jgi:hypothetical protein